jgi:hypothetical protein
MSASVYRKLADHLRGDCTAEVGASDAPGSRKTENLPRTPRAAVKRAGKRRVGILGDDKKGRAGAIGFGSFTSGSPRLSFMRWDGQGLGLSVMRSL